MSFPLKKFLLLGLLMTGFCCAPPIQAQLNLLRSATATQTPVTQIRLTWKSQGTGTMMQIYRRILGQEQLNGNTWGNPIATILAPINNYADTSITPGIAYKYQVYCSKTGTGVGYGYVAAGINVPEAGDRGKILLVVDQTLSTPLAAELTQPSLRQDLNCRNPEVSHDFKNPCFCYEN